jgi:hypothetical protein
MYIKGGYILQPRIIDESKISRFPPHVREIWLYLLRRANHEDRVVHGTLIKRGQLKTSYKDILEDLSWYVGFRKESYKKHHCETAMKLLTREQMITTSKTTRGMIVTVCNYDYYQTPKNYETDSERFNETTRDRQSTDRINKNEKNERMEEGYTEANASMPDAERPTNHEQINYKDLIHFFNTETMGVFGRIVYPISEKRKASIRARIREHGRDTFTEMIRRAAGSNFLKGENAKQWKATFDWMIKPNNFQKIIEGNYDNKNQQNNGRPGPSGQNRAAQGITDNQLAEAIRRGTARALKENAPRG